MTDQRSLNATADGISNDIRFETITCATQVPGLPETCLRQSGALVKLTTSAFHGHVDRCPMGREPLLNSWRLFRIR